MKSLQVQIIFMWQYVTVSLFFNMIHYEENSLALTVHIIIVFKANPSIFQMITVYCNWPTALLENFKIIVIIYLKQLYLKSIALYLVS